MADKETKPPEQQIASLFEQFDLPSRDVEITKVIAAWNVIYSDNASNSSVTFRSDVATSGEFESSRPKPVCESTIFMDVFGTAKTDGSGKLKINLADYVCRGPFFAPAFAVATAVTGRCVTMTINAILTDPENVYLNAESWDSQGDPRPSVDFSWFSRIRTNSGIE